MDCLILLSTQADSLSHCHRGIISLFYWYRLSRSVHHNSLIMSSPQQGSWSTANRTPPSLHPPPHFLELADKRELFRRLLQCRTGHGYMGEYYQRFVPSANPACPCGETTQTREHIIQSCPTYGEYRTIPTPSITNTIST